MNKFKLTANRIFESDIILSLGILSNLKSLSIFEEIRKESKHILITDENVNELYGDLILKQLEEYGFEVLKLVIPPFDESKNIDLYKELVEKCLEYKFDKKSMIFSLGGGVVNNISGFLASTLYRGIGLIHFPTSMLAQVDAAIDFKQAINFKHGKNLIGTYYPASHIIIDPNVLKTLNKRFVYDGLAESIKHAICQDNDFYLYLLSNVNNLDNLEVLYYIINHSIKLKLELMNDDLDDDFDESIKQYGHSVGHAIEHLSHGEIYHGEAISIGMCISTEIGYLLGINDEETVKKHYDIFKLFNLPITIPNEFTFEEIWNKMKYDKHTLNGEIYTGLVSSIGKMAQDKNENFGHYITEDILKKAIEKNRSK